MRWPRLLISARRRTVGHHGAMPERPEPAALPQRRHADTTPAESAQPGADPRVLRRVAEALGDASSPRSSTDRS